MPLSYPKQIRAAKQRQNMDFIMLKQLEIEDEEPFDHIFWDLSIFSVIIMNGLEYYKDFNF